MNVGVISDTHGLLRPSVIEHLAGCDLILHAGDVGAASVLTELKSIVATIAIRGNVDRGTWADDLPDTQRVACEQVQIYMLHDAKALNFDPAAEGIGIVLSGHSHSPNADVRNGVLYLNPGSIGPRRFRLPISMAKLSVQGARFQYQMITLEA